MLTQFRDGLINDDPDAAEDYTPGDAGATDCSDSETLATEAPEAQVTSSEQARAEAVRPPETADQVFVQ